MLCRAMSKHGCNDAINEVPKIDIQFDTDATKCDRDEKYGTKAIANGPNPKKLGFTASIRCGTKDWLRLPLSKSQGLVTGRESNVSCHHLSARSEPSLRKERFHTVHDVVDVKRSNESHSLQRCHERQSLESRGRAHTARGGTTQSEISEAGSESFDSSTLSRTRIAKRIWLDWDNPFQSSRTLAGKLDQTRNTTIKSTSQMQAKDSHATLSSYPSSFYDTINMIEKQRSQQTYDTFRDSVSERQRKVILDARLKAFEIVEQRPINWNIPTVAEGGTASIVHVKTSTMLDYHGKQFEDHCALQILNPTMKAIQWGDIHSPSSKGGLSDLKEFNEESQLRTPRFLATIQRGMQLCADLDTGKSKMAIREGTTHATLTKLMARQYIRAFGDDDEEIEDKPEETPVDPLDRAAIDNSFSDKFIRLRRAQQISKVDGADQQSHGVRLHSMFANKKSPSNKKSTLLSDVAQDVSFEVDIAFMKLKEMDLNSVSMGKADSSKNLTFFLRFSVLEAVALPKMDDTKESYCDTYARCSVQSRKKSKAGVLSSHKGLYRRETNVAWNSRDPVWKQDFEFTLTADINQEIVLIFELYDVNIGHQGMDHYIGYVQFTLFQDGKRCVPLEQEIEESYQLLREESGSLRTGLDEKVRCNNGVVNAEKLGRPSSLRLRTFYSGKPKILPERCALLIQQNVRCMLARRRLKMIKKLSLAFLEQKESTLIEKNLKSASIWKEYCSECRNYSTLPIRNLMTQANSRRMTLQRYPIKLNGCIALSKLVRIMVERNRLQSLILTDLGMKSQGFLPLIEALLESENLETLILDRNPLFEALFESKNSNHSRLVSSKPYLSAKALASLIQGSKTLSLLSLEDTNMCGAEIAIIAGAAGQSWSLKILNLKGNNQDFKSQTIEPAKAVAELLKESTLIDFNYSGNHMNSEAALAFMDGCCLSFLRRLHLSRTGMCKYESVNRSLARYIKDAHCCLDQLDISYCGMDEKGALILSDAVNANSSLQVLILDGNPFGQIGYFCFMTHEGKPKVVIEPQPETADHEDSNTGKMLTPIAQLLVDYVDLRNDSSQEIDPRKLVRFVEGLQIEMDQSEVMQICNDARDKRGVLRDFNSFYEWYISKVTEMVGSVHEESVLLVSLQDCGCSYTQKSFDPLRPFGEYDLNMSLVKSRTILMVLMKLVYAGTGFFMPGVTSCDRDLVSRKITFTPMTIEVDPDISTWSMPDRGFLHFTFCQCDTSVGDVDNLNQVERELEEDLKRREHILERLSLIRKHFSSVSRNSSNSAPYRHAVWILSLLGKFATSDESRLKTLEIERVAVVVAAFDNMNIAKHKFQLLELLNAHERSTAEEQLGIMPFLFTPNNLTGYFRLNLSNVGEREIAIKLFERRSTLKYVLEKRSKHVRGRKGGKRPDVELIWRNARVFTTFFFSTTSTDLTFEMLDRYRIPCAGVLHIDFVDICKPSQMRRAQDTSAVAMDVKEFCNFLQELKSRPSVREKLMEIRRSSAQNYFTCLQVVAMIELFDSMASKERYSRVEVAVCLFSRTIDWRGYRHVLGHVGAALFEDVERRIGRINLYHDEISSPVGFWQLNLEIEEDLWVMQDLVHIAYFEPGNNMVDCAMDDCPFNIPRDWLVEVPAKHTVTLFYTRTQEVTQRYMNDGSWDSTAQDSSTQYEGCFPPYFELPSIDESESPKGPFKASKGSTNTSVWTWMDIEKIRVVADVLRKQCKRASDMFSLIDADGGGEISPAEFSLGLFKIGVWLPPSQMRLLFFVIDFNGDGDISRHEFCQFWLCAPPLRANDAEQRAYWSQRGLPVAQYDRLVANYDVRRWYPPEVVKAYGMEDAKYTLMPERSLEVRTTYDRVTQSLVVSVSEAQSTPTPPAHKILGLLNESPRRRLSVSDVPRRRASISELPPQSPAAAVAEIEDNLVSLHLGI